MANNMEFIEQLEAVIQDRFAQSPAESYTAKLAAKGIAGAAQKVGEEGVETALAAVMAEDGEVIAESADLFFHLLIVLSMRGIRFASVIEELEKRHRDRQPAPAR
jgi:phosphoribosyl-ATP pyrophosphohydrolase/phosphoribosyl-AMP cyclohydrolase